MWTSSIAAAARIALVARVGAGAEQDQHRAQPLAAGVERRPTPPRRAPRRGRGDALGQAVLDLAHPPRQPGLGRVEDRGHRRRHGGAVHLPDLQPRPDAGVDRDDPAGEQQPADPLEPGAVHHRRQAVGAGKPAPTRAGSCRRRGRRRAARAAARCGRTRARRRSRAAAAAGWVISRMTSRPPGRSTRAISADPAVEVGEVADAEADGDRVEAWRRRRAARARRPTRSSTGAPALGAPSRGPGRASARRSRSRPRGPRGRPGSRSSSARSPVPQQTSSARVARARARPGRRRARASDGEAPRSSPSSSGRRPRRCGRTSPGPGTRTPRALAGRLGAGVIAGGAGPRHSGSRPHCSEARKSTRSSNFSGGRSAYEGMIPGRVLERAGDRLRGAAWRRSRSARGRGRRCRSRRSCGRRGSRTGPTTCLPGLVLRGDLDRRSRSASRPRRRGRSGRPSR